MTSPPRSLTPARSRNRSAGLRPGAFGKAGPTPGQRPALRRGSRLKSREFETVDSLPAPDARTPLNRPSGTLTLPPRKREGWSDKPGETARAGVAHDCLHSRPWPVHTDGQSEPNSLRRLEPVELERPPCRPRTPSGRHRKRLPPAWCPRHRTSGRLVRLCNGVAACPGWTAPSNSRGATA